MAIAVEAASQGHRIIWGAPTFDQVRVGWEETHKAAVLVADFNASRLEARFPGGGRILYRSLDDPDNARGHSADGVVVDEAGDVREAAWYEVLRPMLMDTNGWAWCIGTPRGRNWFWREHRGASERTDSVAWQAPTLGVVVENNRLRRQPHPLENPHIPFAELQQMYQAMPERTFRQEILSEFSENQGQVFRNIAACMKAPLDATPEQHKGHRLVAGVDWGKERDWTCVSVLCADCRVEVARDRFNQIDYTLQRGRLKVLHEQWRPDTILAEANAMGAPIIEVLSDEGLPVEPFETTASSKPPLIESLVLAFERVECQWQDDAVWTGELESYERKMSLQTGRSTYSAPEGLHDDTVMARALAWLAATQYGLPFGWIKLPQEARR